MNTEHGVKSKLLQGPHADVHNYVLLQFLLPSFQTSSFKAQMLKNGHYSHLWLLQMAASSQCSSSGDLFLK